MSHQRTNIRSLSGTHPTVVGCRSQGGAECIQSAPFQLISNKFSNQFHFFLIDYKQIIQHRGSAYSFFPSNKSSFFPKLWHIVYSSSDITSNRSAHSSKTLQRSEYSWLGIKWTAIWHFTWGKECTTLGTSKRVDQVHERASRPNTNPGQKGGSMLQPQQVWSIFNLV